MVVVFFACWCLNCLVAELLSNDLGELVDLVTALEKMEEKTWAALHSSLAMHTESNSQFL